MLAASLVPALIVALAFAILLNVYSLWFLRKEHQDADKAFRNVDREFFSVFQNVLDGVLIVDNTGDCLDANPAATEILRCSQPDLVGRNIKHFLPDPSAFAVAWSSFLRAKNQRGTARLVAGDGTELVVDFTAASNYLPDRHVLIICDVTERTNAETLLRKSEERFQHMANNIQEIFWMMDAGTQELLYVNRAYTTITGHTGESLRTNPSSYRELIHPEDRVRVISRLNETLSLGKFDEEFRFTRADGAVRWIWAKGFPVPTDGESRWLVGTAQDITSRKQAEMKIVEQLDAVEAARAEAEALRKATLALSQNLAMDSVLDTLLNCISELVPFDRATVLFVEDGPELMVARESPHTISKRMGLTLKASEIVFLQRLLFEKQAILLTDTSKQDEWQDIVPLERLKSWMAVPLIAGGTVLGILSLGATCPCTFTVEHLRLAKSLSLPAAVAIQNARIHERAEIYAAELQTRLSELGRA
ncbi:MAG TPA: PAS domain S-box protein [Terriglobales bacterium]|nr:PAS domain S-box protein [Terriglobales bacterium]